MDRKRRRSERSSTPRPRAREGAARPLQQLIRRGVLRVGAPLHFDYVSDAGRLHRFRGSLHPRGIVVEGALHSVSFAAIQCIRSAGDDKAVNGWLAWRARSGASLSELYQASEAGARLERRRRPPLYTEKLYRYPAQRDAVFVFGAGASNAAGAPLQREVLPLLFQERDRPLGRTEAYRVVMEFLRANFAWSAEAGRYPSLEQVFGYLDFFIQKGESLGRRYPLARIRVVRESLILLLHHLVTRRTRRGGAAYRLFWDRVYQHNHNVSVITVNYDTCLEDAFAHMFARNVYLDYTLNLVNYDLGDEIDDRNWWVNLRKPILSPERQDPLAVKLIKIHGSLNWKYCNCCSRVLLTPADKLGAGAGSAARGAVSGAERASWRFCPRDGNEFQTLLVPPSHLKDLSHAVISQLFIEAAEEVRVARRVVFAGYSLPEADVHVKAILKRSLQPDTEVVVVDVDRGAELERRHRELSPRTELIHERFEDLVQDGALMERLLAPR